MDGINRRAIITRMSTWGGLNPFVSPGMSRRKWFEARVESLEDRALLAQTLFFAATDGTHGRELWKSDGSAGGTSMVADLNPGAGDSNPQNLFVYNGALLFGAADGTTGSELWKTYWNGTQIVTVELTHSNSLYPMDFTLVGSTVFFSAWDGYHGRELWKTDGTAAGTTLVDDIYPGFIQGGGLNSSNPTDLTSFNGKLYFTATEGTDGRELWTSDGTTAGTKLVKNINPGSADAFVDGTNVNDPTGGPSNGLTAVGSRLLFFANDGTDGRELWESDGTTAGTTLVKNINPGSASAYTNESIYFNKQIVIGSEFYFPATDGDGNGPELWKSDGTTAGTSIVSTLFNSPRWLTSFNGGLYFSANGDILGSGNQLWKVDGSGAAQLSSLAYGDPGYLTAVGSNLYFSAAGDASDPSQFDFELWKYNPTTGTSLVRNINQADNGADGSFPGDLTPFNGLLFFVATDGVAMTGTGRELYSSDGTTTGTNLFKNINPGTADAFLGERYNDFYYPDELPNYLTVVTLVQQMSVRTGSTPIDSAQSGTLQSPFSDETVNALATSLALTPSISPPSDAAVVNLTGTVPHKHRVVTMIS